MSRGGTEKGSFEDVQGLTSLQIVFIKVHLYG